MQQQHAQRELLWLKISLMVVFLYLVTTIPSMLKAAYSATSNSVFSWREVPLDQDVPITHAVFDRGGYQLHDTAGETIVVPYTKDSLCVLKFARSNTGKMYLVNDGCKPVLYVPAHGNLDNATVPKAHWYPFANGYTPTHPVYMAVAPSVESYNRMGWYPESKVYGGYRSDRYADPSSSLILGISIIFIMGGHHYDGWQSYDSYSNHHRTNYHTAYYNPQVYHWAVQPKTGVSFIGHRQMWAHHSMKSSNQQYRVMSAASNVRVLNRAAPIFHAKPILAIGHTPTNARTFKGATPIFHGNPIRAIAHNTSNARTFKGVTPAFQNKQIKTNRMFSRTSVQSAGRSNNHTANQHVNRPISHISNQSAGWNNNHASNQHVSRPVSHISNQSAGWNNNHASNQHASRPVSHISNQSAGWNNNHASNQHVGRPVSRITNQPAERAKGRERSQSTIHPANHVSNNVNTQNRGGHSQNSSDSGKQHGNDNHNNDRQHGK